MERFRQHETTFGQALALMKEVNLRNFLHELEQRYHDLVYTRCARCPPITADRIVPALVNSSHTALAPVVLAASRGILVEQSDEPPSSSTTSLATAADVRMPERWQR